MKEEISKLQDIRVDPFTAWQASKRLQKGLSHHHSNSKDKYTKLKKSDGTLTDKPEEQVRATFLEKKSLAEMLRTTTMPSKI
jgi:hypothetical protein